MKIEAGKCYKDGWDFKRTVMGKAVKIPRIYLDDPLPTYYNDIYWTTHGLWYREDGRYAPGGTPNKNPTKSDLVAEVLE